MFGDALIVGIVDLLTAWNSLRILFRPMGSSRYFHPVNCCLSNPLKSPFFPIPMLGLNKFSNSTSLFLLVSIMNLQHPSVSQRWDSQFWSVRSEAHHYQGLTRVQCAEAHKISSGPARTESETWGLRAGERAKAGPCGGGRKVAGRGEGRRVSASSPVTPIR